MIPEQARNTHAFATWTKVKAGLAGLVALAIGMGTADRADAQSAYACRALETHAALPSVEGDEGMFFRILPDLQAHHAMADDTIAKIGALSKALDARGTTLVFLPVPGRAQVMAHQLPAMARHLGYDPDLATAVHVDMVARLKAADVLVADPRSALRQAALAGTPVFFQTDPRPTPEGARVMAQVIGETLKQAAATKDLSRTTFTTTQGDTFTLPSAMRARLQLGCQDALPKVSASAFVTAGNAAATTPGVAAILGTGITGTDDLNLAGFISEFSGLRAGAYGVAGGGAFAAISSYLTSADFRETPPQVIVWEVPVSENLVQNGDQPLFELIAAASQTCTTPLPLRTGDATNKVLADLSGLPAGQRYTLALDTDGAAVPDVRFHFASEDGQTRSRGIYRNPDQILTGRFYMPLSGLEDTGLRQVMIELPAAFGARPSLTACPQGVTR